jgi:ferrochelatase
LLAAHGTVDDLDDLAAFVQNVRRGRPAEAAVVAELRRRYEAIGGTSPLNGTNALLASKLEKRLGVRVAWANRLWRPYVRDVLADLARQGTTRVALLPLAQYSTHVYEGDARPAAEQGRLELACAPNWGREPALCAAFAERIAAVLAGLDDLPRTTVVMTAHSLPRAVVERGDPYEDDVRRSTDEIASAVRRLAGRDVRCVVAYQSQALGAASDGESTAWLGPSVRNVLDGLHARADRQVVFAPVGFLADNVEILYDLDIEARAMAAERDLLYSRARSLNADDDLVGILAALARPLIARA